MSEKTKEFVKMAFKEGSISILTFTVSTLTILHYYPNSLIIATIEYAYLIGFILTFGIIIYRIVLSQFIISALRIDKLKQDIKKKDYTDLKSDELNNLILPITKELVQRVSESILKRDGDDEHEPE